MAADNSIEEFLYSSITQAYGSLTRADRQDYDIRNAIMALEIGIRRRGIARAQRREQRERDLDAAIERRRRLRTPIQEAAE